MKIARYRLLDVDQKNPSQVWIKIDCVASVCG